MANFIVTQKSPLAESDDIFSIKIDGKKCITINDFFDEIAKKLKFPTYFGKNLDALDECLTDLSWIDQDQIVVNITNFNELLEEESLEAKELIITLMDDAADELNQAGNYVIKYIVKGGEEEKEFLDELGLVD